MSTTMSPNAPSSSAKPISVRLPPDLQQDLQLVAEISRLSTSQIIRDAVKNHLAKYLEENSPQELAASYLANFMDSVGLVAEPAPSNDIRAEVLREMITYVAAHFASDPQNAEQTKQAQRDLRSLITANVEQQQELHDRYSTQAAAIQASPTGPK